MGAEVAVFAWGFDGLDRHSHIDLFLLDRGGRRSVV